MSIIWNEIPEFIQQYKDQILATKKSAIELNLTPRDDLTLWQSKVGGQPYLPLGVDYPCNENGEALQLIAQINFAELPNNQIYPNQGILQFYIDTQDDLLGLDFDDQQKQNGFRVVYFADVIEDQACLQHDFPTEELDEDMSPIAGQYTVQFAATERYISIGDHEFSSKIFDPYTIDEDLLEEGDLFDDYEDNFSSNGHHLGGYPFFTQEDPRTHDDRFKDYVLLLQIDTDDAEDVQIMWGDSGVANFFIHPDDLKNRDFSKVLYNWDCY
ncbi:YwqG family protein [Acinetobacter sp. Marseille-Q1618]|uniref:YwqG family protein n=1 Tax=Acinetobacter sp. Marseille-Q1618 TaxID=2697502 RepID=UPI00156D48C2|nr:YwqG family protein [Acinetobacter sp. Marseille-Q1618]